MNFFLITVKRQKANGLWYEEHEIVTTRKANSLKETLKKFAEKRGFLITKLHNDSWPFDKNDSFATAWAYYEKYPTKNSVECVIDIVKKKPLRM